MRPLLRKLLKSEDRIDDFASLLTSLTCSQGKSVFSRKVRKRIDGKLNVSGRLYFGFLTNRVGLDPSAHGVLRVYEDGELRINGHVRIARSCKVFVAGSCVIGDKTYINPGTMIFARTNVSIGSNCAISWNCEIIDDDFHQIESSCDSSLPITIEDNVWIGSNSSILKGVTVGEGSVIGSRSVVTKNIPPRSLAVGVPARVIKSEIKWT